MRSTHNGRWVAAALALAVTPVAPAMQMDLTPAELCQVADAVVVGRVSDQETLWAAVPEGGLERRAFVDVSKVLRGPASKSVEVVLPGGRIGEFWHWVEDVPVLEQDAWYLLTLARTERGWETIGGERGAVRLAVSGSGQGVPVDHAIAALEGCHVAR